MHIKVVDIDMLISRSLLIASGSLDKVWHTILYVILLLF